MTRRTAVTNALHPRHGALAAFVFVASALRLLSPLARTGMKHQLSIFTDDVMIFLKLVAAELAACSEIQQMFGTASGL